MKRIIIILVLIIICFNGCSVSGKMNLSVFIDNYNHVSGKNIDFTDFSGCRNDIYTEYSFFIEDGISKSKAYVVLKANVDEITECRISCIKLDDLLKTKAINDNDKHLFVEAVKDVSYAFTSENDSALDIKLSNILSDLSSEEKTDTFKNYYMILISNDLTLEFIIRNMHFYEEETTEKPENINSFLNTAPVRTETVPHR